MSSAFHFSEVFGRKSEGVSTQSIKRRKTIVNTKTVINAHNIINYHIVYVSKNVEDYKFSF